MELVFQWRQGKPPTGTIDASVLQPHLLRTRSIAELDAEHITIGNHPYRWNEVFSISGECSDTWVVPGSINYLNLGHKLASGTLRVMGDAGDYAGSQMTGGRLEILGSTGHRLGASMAGGLITVTGDAGAEAGGPAPDSFDGMSDGEIVIQGAAGPRAGFRLRRGLIAMQSASEQAGHQMQAGTLVIQQGPLLQPGMSMKRGTIVCLDATTEPTWLPYFQPDCIFRPVILQILLGRLATLGFKAAADYRHSSYQLYSGDRLARGKAEIFQRVEA